MTTANPAAWECCIPSEGLKEQNGELHLAGTEKTFKPD